MLVVMVVRFIGWLKTAMMLLLSGMPPAFEPGTEREQRRRRNGGGLDGEAAGHVLHFGAGSSDHVHGTERCARGDDELRGQVGGVVHDTGPETPSAAPPTLIPGPKLAVVVPFTQLVYWPIIVTVHAVARRADVRIDLRNDRRSRGYRKGVVQREGLAAGGDRDVGRWFTDAFERMVMLAVNCVVLFTVTKLAVIPSPNVADEKPCWKVVKTPLMTTLTVVDPACCGRRSW